MELTNDFEVSTGVEEAWTVLTDVERIAPCLPGAELREIEGDEYRGVVKVKVGPISAEYKGSARFVELDHKAYRAVLRAEGREARGQGNAAATITAVLEPSGRGTRVSVVTDLSITGKVAQFGRGVLGDVSARLLGQFVENLEATVIEHGEDESTAAGGTGHDDHEAGDAGAEQHGKPARGARRQSGGRAQRAGQHAEVAEPEPEAEPAAEADAADAAAEAEAVETELASTNGSSGKHERHEHEHEHHGHHEEHEEHERSEGATVRRLEPRPAEPVDLMEVAGPSVARRIVPLVVAALVLAMVVAGLRRRRT